MQIRNLSVLAYAQGFTHWLYRIDEIPVGYITDWNDSGFWNDARDMFQIGDMITVSANQRRTNPFSGGARIVQIAVDDNVNRVRVTTLG